MIATERRGAVLFELIFTLLQISLYRCRSRSHCFALFLAR